MACKVSDDALLPIRAQPENTAGVIAAIHGCVKQAGGSYRSQPNNISGIIAALQALQRAIADQSGGGGGLSYKGTADFTTAAPESPANGDLYVNTTTGVIDASWSGIGGETVNAGAIAIYGGSQWSVAGNTDVNNGVQSVTASAPLGVNGSDAKNPNITIQAASQQQEGVVRMATQAELDSGNAEPAVPNGKTLQAAISKRTPAASTASAGLVQLANESDAQSGLSASKALTPRAAAAAFVKSPLPAANNSKAGIVRLATTAEAADGNSALIAATPKGVRDFHDGNTYWIKEDGYIKTRVVQDPVFVNGQLEIGGAFGSPGILITPEGGAAFKEGVFAETGITVGNSAFDPNAELLADGSIKGLQFYASAYNGGPLAGFRNLLINGNMALWRRYGNHSTTALGYHSADRWNVFSLGDKSPETSRYELDSDGPYQYSLHLSDASYTGQVMGLRQAIELERPGSLAPFTAGSKWTLSYWQLGMSEINAQITFSQGISGMTSGKDATGEPRKNVGQIGNWYRYQETFTIPESIGSSMDCAIVALWQKNISFYVTGIQLEPGDRATPFELRPMTIETQLADRYYQKLPWLQSVDPYGNSTSCIAFAQRVVPLRVDPINEGCDKPSGASTDITFDGNAQLISASFRMNNPGLAPRLDNYYADAEFY